MLKPRRRLRAGEPPATSTHRRRRAESQVIRIKFRSDSPCPRCLYGMENHDFRSVRLQFRSLIEIPEPETPEPESSGHAPAISQVDVKTLAPGFDPAPEIQKSGRRARRFGLRSFEPPRAPELSEPGGMGGETTVPARNATKMRKSTETAETPTENQHRQGNFPSHTGGARGAEDIHTNLCRFFSLSR